MINEAEGQAQQIRAVAAATAEGIRQVAEQMASQGGRDAASLRVAEQYVEQFGKLARETNTLIIPGNTGDVSSMVAQALATFESVKKG
jgi:regulator of protease activity HflC (stomatin/prohibitin superfamily)